VLSVKRLVQGHLSEREMMAAWQEGRLSAHLDACVACQDRYVELLSFLDRQRLAALDAADDAFTPDRLAAQKSQVLRRLENLARPVRVLAFPHQRRVAPSVNRAGRRWVAVAAAAGLIIGLAAGLAVNVHPFGSDFAQRGSFTRASNGRPDARAESASGPRVQTTPDRLVTDEAFLTELEAALDGPRVEELAALDALTPRVRDVALLVR